MKTKTNTQFVGNKPQQAKKQYAGPELAVHGTVGDITQGVFLGELKDESKEISLRAQLSKSTLRYSCGVNALENIVEVWSCGYKVTASASALVVVDIYCKEACCKPTKPDPCPQCPDPIRPPDPPDESDDGPADRPDP